MQPPRLFPFELESHTCTLISKHTTTREEKEEEECFSLGQPEARDQENQKPSASFLPEVEGKHESSCVERIKGPPGFITHALLCFCVSAGRRVISRVFLCHRLSFKETHGTPIPSGRTFLFSSRSLCESPLNGSIRFCGFFFIRDYLFIKKYILNS